MANVILGNHTAVVFPRAEQARIRQFYRDVLWKEHPNVGFRAGLPPGPGLAEGHAGVEGNVTAEQHHGAGGRVISH